MRKIAFSILASILLGLTAPSNAGVGSPGPFRFHSQAKKEKVSIDLSQPEIKLSQDVPEDFNKDLARFIDLYFGDQDRTLSAEEMNGFFSTNPSTLYVPVYMAIPSNKSIFGYQHVKPRFSDLESIVIPDFVYDTQQGIDQQLRMFRALSRMFVVEFPIDYLQISGFPNNTEEADSSWIPALSTRSEAVYGAGTFVRTFNFENEKTRYTITTSPEREVSCIATHGENVVIIQKSRTDYDIPFIIEQYTKTSTGELQLENSMVCSRALIDKERQRHNSHPPELGERAHLSDLDIAKKLSKFLTRVNYKNLSPLAYKN